MLEWFQNFFLSLGEAIASVFTLIVSLIKSLLDFITLLPTVVTMLVSSIGFYHLYLLCLLHCLLLYL